MAKNKKEESKKSIVRELYEDEDASVFKRLAVLTGILLIAFAFVLAAIKIGFTVKEHSDKKKITTIALSSNYGYILKCEDLLGKDIVVDEKFDKEVKKNSKYILKHYKGHTFSSRQLAGILLIDKYLNKGKKKKDIYADLDKYYDKDKNLFIDVDPDIYGTVSDDLTTVQNTISIAYLLSDYDEALENYKIYDGLAKWFNDTIVIVDNQQYESDLKSVFWFMYDEGRIKDLNYDRMQNILAEDVANYKRTISTKDADVNIDFVTAAARTDAYRTLFYNDKSYKKRIEDLYGSIDGDKDLLLDIYKSNFISAFCVSLNYIEKPSSNDYVKEHVTYIIKRYYETYMKEEEE